MLLTALRWHQLFSEDRLFVCLEQILRQLVAVHAEKLHCNGGQGEVFRLQKHMAAEYDGVINMIT